MPRKRVVMRQVREVLRLKWACGLSDRQIAHSLGISRPTVADYVRRAQRAGLSWPLPDTLDDPGLERQLAAATSIHRVSSPVSRIRFRGRTTFMFRMAWALATGEAVVWRDQVAVIAIQSDDTVIGASPRT